MRLRRRLSPPASLPLWRPLPTGYPSSTSASFIFSQSFLFVSLQARHYIGLAEHCLEGCENDHVGRGVLEDLSLARAAAARWFRAAHCGAYALAGSAGCAPACGRQAAALGN